MPRSSELRNDRFIQTKYRLVAQRPAVPGAASKWLTECAKRVQLSRTVEFLHSNRPSVPAFNVELFMSISRASSFINPRAMSRTELGGCWSKQQTLNRASAVYFRCSIFKPLIERTTTTPGGAFLNNHLSPERSSNRNSKFAWWTRWCRHSNRCP